MVSQLHVYNNSVVERAVLYFIVHLLSVASAKYRTVNAK
jgi:hypothetical protein